MMDQEYERANALLDALEDVLGQMKFPNPRGGEYSIADTLAQFFMTARLSVKSHQEWWHYVISKPVTFLISPEEYSKLRPMPEEHTD